MEISGFTFTTESLWMYQHDYTLIVTLKQSVWNVGLHDLCYNFDPVSVIDDVSIKCHQRLDEQLNDPFLAFLFKEVVNEIKGQTICLSSF